MGTVLVFRVVGSLVKDSLLVVMNFVDSPASPVVLGLFAPVGPRAARLVAFRSALALSLVLPVGQQGGYDSVGPISVHSFC